MNENRKGRGLIWVVNIFTFVMFIWYCNEGFGCSYFEMKKGKCGID